MSVKQIIIADIELGSLVEGMLETVGDSDHTAYRVAVLVNGVFETAGVEKRIPTQMAYTYTRNGLIAKGKKGKASEIRYTNDEVRDFVVKYCSKHLQEFLTEVDETEAENVEA